MALSGFLKALIVVAGCFVAIALIVDNFGALYNPTLLNENDTAFLSEINTTASSTSSFAAGFESNTTNEGFIGSIVTFGSGVMTAILSVKQSTDAGVSMIGQSEKSITTIFPGSQFIFIIIISILAVFITLTILAYITRTQP